MASCLMAKKWDEGNPDCRVCDGKGGFFNDKGSFSPCPRCCGLSTGELNMLEKLLGKMGLTPADRSKISVPADEKAVNPFAEIAQETKPARPN